MNQTNTIMITIFLALAATTTGLVTALSMMSQQTALAVRQGGGGGCGVGGGGGILDTCQTFSGGIGLGGSSNGAAAEGNAFDQHCGQAVIIKSGSSTTHGSC
jgi:hypothetical protein